MAEHSTGWRSSRAHGLSGACAAGSAWGQAQRLRRGGPGESASAWHGILAWRGWILLAVVVFGGLLWMALAGAGTTRRPTPRARRPRAGPAAPPPAPACRGAGLRRPRADGAHLRSHRGRRARLRRRPRALRATRRGCARSPSSSVTATAGSWSAGRSRVTTSTSTTWGMPSGTTRPPERWRAPWSAWPSGRRASPRDSSPAGSPAASTSPPPTARGAGRALRRDPPRHPEGSSGSWPRQRRRQRGPDRGAPRARGPPDPPRLSAAEAAALRRPSRRRRAPRPPTCEQQRAERGHPPGHPRGAHGGGGRPGDRRRAARGLACVDKAKGWEILSLPWWAWLLLAAPALLFMILLLVAPLAELSPGRTRNAGLVMLGLLVAADAVAVGVYLSPWRPAARRA